MTREYIIEAYKKLRIRLGRQPSKEEFYEHTTVNNKHILTTFRTFSHLVKEMGDTPKIFFKERKSDEEYMIPYGNMIRQLKRIPTLTDWIVHKCKPVETSYKRRFHLREFSSVANEFLLFAKNKNEWEDVLKFIPTDENSQKSIFPEKVSDECYVYLMFDSQNACYKIGISNIPEWREKTLQSQKPSIKLIAAKKFVNRRIAANFEKALHDSYSHRRKRGEWFILDQEDIEEIKITLKE
jgi:hypothetical protein